MSAFRCGECDLALACGVNAILTPRICAILATAGRTSSTGRCHTFDSVADGYARGEACCVAAVSSSDAPPWGLPATAVRCDGKSASLTAPNGESQRMLVNVCAAVSSNRLGYGMVEMHGTGTALGDPIEMRSFVSSGACPSGVGSACDAGSLKANAGHAEPAAGLCGFIKLVSSLRSPGAPPNAQLRTINAHVTTTDQGAARVHLPTQVGRLPCGAPVEGGVSSFGYNGTIAHAVLASAHVQTVPSSSMYAGRDGRRVRRRRFLCAATLPPPPGASCMRPPGDEKRSDEGCAIA